MEWYSLSELAGKPIGKWVIQVIRDKVRKSIMKEIAVSVECDIQTSLYWCPLVFTIFVDSKTPATIKISGIDYLFSIAGNPVQSGYWRKGMRFVSNGFELHNFDPIIKGKTKGKIDVAVNPTLLNYFPSDSKQWGIKGSVQIDSAFGVIYMSFDENSVKIDHQRWLLAQKEFNMRFPKEKG